MRLSPLFLLVLLAAAAPFSGCNSPAASSSSSSASSSAPLTEAAFAGAVVLDVRTASEHASGHVKGDHNIAVDDLDAKAADVAALVGADKSKPVIVYCRSGNRSARAKRILTAQGYTNVTDAGGFSSIVGQIPALRAE
jgi:phage shock protein E